MSYQIELGNFDSDVQFLDVAGTFNDWNGDQLYAIEDNIYMITITNVEIGDSLEFKFRIDGSWDNSEFPGGGPDRNYTVLQGENSLEYWYNDESGD